MIYTFRITLPGIKGFYRIYKVNGSNSLYRFHKQIQADLEFAQDQPILFKAMDSGGSVSGRYALIDLGCGTVDEVTVERAIKDGATHFWYFHDTRAKKYVIVTLEGEPQQGCLEGPTLQQDMKGPNPIAFENGYVAFEDLPEVKNPGHKCKCGDEDCDGDCDCDDEEDEDTDEALDEEEIYDSEE